MSLKLKRKKTSYYNVPKNNFEKEKQTCSIILGPLFGIQIFLFLSEVCLCCYETIVLSEIERQKERMHLASIVVFKN